MVKAKGIAKRRLERRGRARVKVDVTFTPTANPTQAFGITIVPTRNDCGPTGGWYVDDLVTPTTLTLCDASCQKVNGAGEGALSLLFGCVAK